VAASCCMRSSASNMHVLLFYSPGPGQLEVSFVVFFAVLKRSARVRFSWRLPQQWLPMLACLLAHLGGA
jgi:hypothetical protein